VSASTDAHTIGLIGLGNMGTPFAERVLAAGYELVVYNRTPEKARACGDLGATVATSPRDLAQRVDVLLTSLPDDRALEDVAAEAIESARPGTILVDLSTVSPTASANVAALADAASVGYLRAPVSGNPTVVRAGALSVIVSGPREVFERAEDVIRAIGPTVYYVGDGEQARVVKLSLNLMIAGLAQLMAEALVLGEAAGVDRATLLEVMGASAVGAPFVKYKTEPLLRDDYSATFTTSLMEKDLDLILGTAADAEVELPLARALRSLMRATSDGGYADQDFMAVYLQLRRASGLDATVSRVGA
jgi:3-hydroxyisobutyrate dehydrogenase-like beta-hydroxyacid dehydrogenase